MIEILAAVAMVLYGVLIGQGPDNLIVLQEDPNGKVGAVVVTTSAGSQTLDARNAGLEVSASGALGTVRTYSDQELGQLFAAALAAQPPAPKSYLLYFDTGASTLDDAARRALAEALADIAARPLARVSVIGHTDRAGGAGVNARLALERAQQVRQILEGDGVPAAAITAVSHGENDLLVPTADGVSEPRNRRVEILVR